MYKRLARSGGSITSDATRRKTRGCSQDIVWKSSRTVSCISPMRQGVGGDLHHTDRVVYLLLVVCVCCMLKNIGPGENSSRHNSPPPATSLPFCARSIISHVIPQPQQDYPPALPLCESSPTDKQDRHDNRLAIYNVRLAVSVDLRRACGKMSEPHSSFFDGRQNLENMNGSCGNR